MQPVLTLAEYNGAAPGTPTNSVPQISYASADVASTTQSSAANPVGAGNNSFEKYQALYVQTPSTNLLSGFMVGYSATAPTDSNGSASTITVYYATNVTYATPVATTSTKATSLCSSDTSNPGTAMLTAPANSAGSYSGLIVEQVRLTAASPGGNFTFANPWRIITYLYA